MVIQIQERCIQNVCTPFPLLDENDIFNNYRLSTPNNGFTDTGTLFTGMCTLFLLLDENDIFNNYRLYTPNNGYTDTGTVYTECVYTVPVAR